MDYIAISILASAILILIVVAFEGFDQLKAPPVKTIFAAVNLIVAVVLFALYQTITTDNEVFMTVYFWIAIAEYVALFGFMTLFFVKTVLAKKELSLFSKSIKHSPWNTYLILDKKDRIKDISDNLLVDLDLDRDSVIGNKLFDVVNKSIRVSRVNAKNYTNRQLEEKYLEIKKISKPNELLKLEIDFFNAEGDTTIIHMIDQAMFSRIGYYGRFLIGEKKTDFNLLGIEKQLKHTEEQLNSLQAQFLATLEVSQEGLAFSDIDEQTTWISNSLKDDLGFDSNNVATEDFLKLIQPDDLNKYLSKINQLTPSSPTLEMKYRLYTNGVYRWYSDVSKRLFLENQAMLMSSINPVATTHFMASNIQVLDELGDKNELMVKLNSLIDEERYFHFVVLRLKNLPYVNEQHGRDVGNMAIAEYLRKLRSSFVSEPTHMFRLTGSTFGIILDDQRKMNLIRKGVQGNDDYLNMTLEYGSSKLELEVFAGISIVNRDGYNEQELLDTALQALKVAENPKYKGHVCYYGEI